VKVESVINSTSSKSVLVCLVYLAAGVASIYISLVALGKIAWPGACIEEELGKIPDVSSISFRIVYSNCDTLAKQEAVTIYASPATTISGTQLERWFESDTLLFSYVPAYGEITAPVVTSPRSGYILISIPEVSSVLYKREKWRDISVGYKIDRSLYP
jgi:hypothetical protein